MCVTAAPPKAGLEKRKGGPSTVTETTTSTTTATLNVTITIHTTTELFYTSTITFFQPTTITNNITTTESSLLPTTMTSSRSASETKARVAPDLATSGDGTTKTSSTSHSTLGAASSSTATPLLHDSTQHRLPTAAVLGITFGVLGLLALIVSIWLLVRRFYRMYRRERVARKQAQTEGNDLPMSDRGEVLKVGTGNTNNTGATEAVGREQNAKRMSEDSDLTIWSREWK